MRALLLIALSFVASLASAQGIKISELPPAAALTGTEPVPTVQGGATVATTPDAIAAFIAAEGGITQTFTPLTLSVTGFSNLTQVTGVLIRTGALCTLRLAPFNGTSNTTTLVVTGLPATCRPTTPQGAWVRVTNGGSNTAGIGILQTDGSGAINFFIAVGSAFTASGNKGLDMGFTINYYPADAAP